MVFKRLLVPLQTFARTGAVGEHRSSAPSWAIATSSILSNLAFAAIAFVQIGSVAHLGVEAIAAVGTGQRVFSSAQSVFVGLTAGMSALIARAWGADDPVEAGRLLITSLIIALAVGAGMAAFGMLFSGWIAGTLGLDPKTTTMAANNIWWAAAFMIAFAINVSIATALRATGSAWIPLALVVAVNVLAFLMLDPLVNGLGGLPKMDTAGAPLAMGFALGVGSVTLLCMLFKQRLRIRFEPKNWRDASRYKQILRLGIPAALEQIVFNAGLLGFLALIGHYYGAEAVAAYVFALSTIGVGLVLGLGLATTTSITMAQQLGKGEVPRAKHKVWRSAIMAFAIVGLLSCGLGLAAGTLVDSLGANAKMSDYARLCLYILILTLPLIGTEQVLSGALRGLGDTTFVLTSTFLGLIGIRCGVAALSIAADLSVGWMYSAIILEYVFRILLLSWRVRSIGDTYNQRPQ